MERSNRLVPALFLVMSAAAAAFSAVAAMRGMSVAWPLTAAVAGGTFAYVAMRVRHSASGWNQFWIVALTAASAGLGCWVVALKRADPIAAPSRPARVTIQSPNGGVGVGQIVNPVSGTMHALPPGDVLWPMVQPYGVPKYYLSSTSCQTTAPGRWSCGPVYVGTDGWERGRYRILIRILDGRDLQQALDGWLGAARRRRHEVWFRRPLGRPGDAVAVRRVGSPSGEQ